MMPRFIVYERVEEVVTYKHIIEDAADEDEARRIVLNNLRPDEGIWDETISQGRTITAVHDITEG